jgi:hypothetical protein
MSSPQKISQLTTAGPLTGAELVPIVQNGGTLQTTVSILAAFAVVSISPVVSALQTQIDQVSAAAASNTTAITSVQADVSALNIRVASVSAATSVNAAAITSIDNVVSALDVRVSILEAAVSNIGDVSAIAGLVSNVAALDSDVSALTIRVAAVSASVSALQIQLDAVSALTSVNAAAITSINNTVSALEIRVSSASTTGVNNTASITSINAVISSLAISVSADVSAKVNRNNDFMTNVQYIDFNTTTSYAPSAGRLTWDIESGTLDLGLTGTVNLLIGQRTVAQVYNNSGVTLPKDKAVKVTGAQGQRLTGALAQADSDADSMTIFGIMLETVSVNKSGYVATDGLVRNVNTLGYSDGDIVYLSPVSAGELTPTKPVAPQHLVQMGYIVNGGSGGAGEIYVKVQNGYEIGELHDVKTSAEASIANGEVLAWNTSASVWTNSTALLDTQASVSALNIQVAAVSASVSALQVQLDAVSAALTSVNNTVSALEIRVSTVSAQASAIQTQVDAVSAAVSAVLVSVGQRVLKAGDTMSGELNMADNLVTRPKFKDYALTAVIKGSVSATTTLDMTEGNFFTALIAGSTTFVFANPPVSAANGPAAGGFVLELQNGASATITWPTAVDWPGGVAPALTATGYDVLVFITDDGGTVWRGVLSMKDSK